MGRESARVCNRLKVDSDEDDNESIDEVIKSSVMKEFEPSISKHKFEKIVSIYTYHSLFFLLFLVSFSTVSPLSNLNSLYFILDQAGEIDLLCEESNKFRMKSRSNEGEVC